MDKKFIVVYLHMMIIIIYEILNINMRIITYEGVNPKYTTHARLVSAIFLRLKKSEISLIFCLQL